MSLLFFLVSAVFKAAWLNLTDKSTNAFSILPHVLDPKLRQTLPAMCPAFRLLGTCYRSLGRINVIAALPSAFTQRAAGGRHETV